MIYQVVAEPCKDQESGRAVVWEVPNVATPEEALIKAIQLELQYE